MSSSPRGRRPRRSRAPALLLLVAGLLLLPPPALRPATAGPIEGEPPYPPSERITDLSLDWTTLRRLAPGSDNWHTTWAGDGQVYSSWGDGSGLGGSGSQARVSLGLARLTGNTAALLGGVNLIGGVRPRVATCWKRFTGELADPNQGGPCYRVGRHGKSRSLLGLGNYLYAWVTPGSGTTGYQEARIYRAPLNSPNRWEQGFAFSRNAPDAMLSPAMVQAGRAYADIPDYVYAFANRYAPEFPDDNGSDIMLGGEVYLLRAAKGANLLSRSSWQFFAGLDANGAPGWTTDSASKRPAITVPSGVGRIGSAIYVRALDRFLFLTEHTQKSAGYFALLEAPKPWGPWRTVAHTRLTAPGDTQYGGFFYSILPTSVRDGGAGFTLIYTGGGAASDAGDALLAVDGRFTLGAAP